VTPSKSGGVGAHHDAGSMSREKMRRLNAVAFAPEALPPSLKLRRTAVALAEAGRRASPKPEENHAERRRETAEAAEKFQTSHFFTG